MNRRLAHTVTLGGLASLLIAPLPAAALSLDWTLKGETTAEADAGRDVGLSGNGDQQRLYLDLTPWVHAQFNPQWGAFLRARAFVPSGGVLLPGNDNNNVGASSNAFVGLKEAWVEYGGLTSYPGESLRLGRQRMREDDALWWDQDVDSLRWIFDTTLLQAQLAVAHQFSTYRSDDAPLPPAQRDRSYALATLGTEWRPGNRIGLRLAHADDSHALPAVGSPVDGTTKLQKGHLNWIGVYADNHAYEGPYDDPAAPALAYWESVSWELGSQRQAQVDSTDTVTAIDDSSVHAWSEDAGLRYRLPWTAFPLQLGAAYVYSSGGHAGDPSHQFTQTGLQSNYSHFTGTRALLSRFTDAFRPELGNLKVLTGFASMNFDAYDASLIYNHYERVDGAAPVVSDNLLVSPTTGSVDLGDGYDLVFSSYFGGRHGLPRYVDDDNPDDSIRLRGSLFQPGAAYGADAKSEYRVTLELTLWY